VNKKAGLIVAVVVGVVVLVSVALSAGPAHQPPVIASVEVKSDRVFASGSTDIVCVASSPVGSELSYEWSASGGLIQGTGASVTWIAADSEGQYTVSVTVTDTRGATATDSVGINVTSNRPPEIDSLTADAEWAVPDGSIMVSCNASDPDGHELRYDWTATGGHISGTDPKSTWTAPEDLGIYAITVTVTDGHGGSATETLHVRVVSGQPPVIEALVVTKDRHGHCYLQKASFGYHAGREQKYDIECTASHPDGLHLVYEWEWQGGEVSETSADGSMITWTAPDSSGYVTITVTVSDIAGNSASETVSLNVVACSVCRFGHCP